MPAIIEFPTIVEEAVNEFGWIFANHPERWHFAEYLTGLLVAERKNVSGINREFAVTTDQSCLNRWITEVAWDATLLNAHRLAWLQRDPSTRYSAQGVIALDNTLIDHAGQLIEDVGWFWDHADQRHVIAHDYLIANYVCTSGKHYPLEFRRFRKKEVDPDAFKNHTVLFKELVDWVLDQAIPGTQCPRPAPGRTRSARPHGLSSAWGRTRSAPPPSSTPLGGVIGARLCARRHRLSQLWRTAAPDRRADRPRLGPALSARRGATHPAATAWPTSPTAPTRVGLRRINPYSTRHRARSFPRRVGYASKPVYPQPLRGQNNRGPPSNGPSLKEPPRKGAHPSLKEGKQTPIRLDPTP